MDKHLPGAFAADPVQYGVAELVRRDRALPHPEVLRHEDPALHARLRDHARETLARVAAKNYRNGVLQPERLPAHSRSARRRSSESPMVNDPLTQYMFCSPDEGAAAVVLCRAEIAHRYTSTPIYLRASVVRTRRLGAFEVHSPWLPLERADAPTVDASRAAYEMAGLGPEDVDVVQLQDTDAGAEVIHMAENGFCKDGEQEALMAEGATEIGGSLPVNTDGGLIANGEPIGASGLRQIHELVLQLRGAAGRPAGARHAAGRLQPALRRARARRAWPSSPPEASAHRRLQLQDLLRRAPLVDEHGPVAVVVARREVEGPTTSGNGHVREGRAALAERLHVEGLAGGLDDVGQQGDLLARQLRRRPRHRGGGRGRDRVVDGGARLGRRGWWRCSSSWPGSSQVTARGG